MNKRIIIVTLLLFSIGFGLVLYSIIYLFSIINPLYISSPVPQCIEAPSGFLFFTSENIIETVRSSLLFSIDELKYQEGNVHVKIFADFFCSMSNDNNSNSTFFVLQAFHNISEINVVVNGQNPEAYGKKETTITYNRSATSYLLVDIPRENVSGHIQVFIEFTWKDVFWRRSFYKYNFVVSFNSGFPNYINEVGLPKEVINGNGLLLPDVTSRTILSIVKPDRATISEAMPNPDVIGFSEGKVWYNWDIKKRSDRNLYASTAVSIDMEIDELKKKYESSWAYFTLFLGVGIPIMISSFVQFLKLYQSTNSNDYKRYKVRRTPRISLNSDGLR